MSLFGHSVMFVAMIVVIGILVILLAAIWLDRPPR
jgi:hypothetical protein